MLSFVLIKTGNAEPIPIMKNPPNTMLNLFYEFDSVENRCNLKPKALAVNKAQQQLRPESFFLDFLNRLPS